MRKISLFLVGVFLLLSSGNLFAQETFTIGTFTYTVTVAADDEGNGGEVSVAKNGTPSEAIEIPESVTNSSTSITYSVTSIKSAAFIGCSGLPSVTIPSSVTSIGNQAFQSCSGLTSITIPSSVTSIGSAAFRGCSGLTSITIPSSVTSIGANAFNSCTGLTSVTIPNSVTSIGDYAFYYCRRLTSVTIPNSVTSIGDYAFQSCSGLTSVTIGTGVTSIGSYAFYACTSLTSITIPNSVTSISTGAFRGCSGLTSVTIGTGVTSIGDYAFQSCSGLTSVTIPNSVTSIGDYAFQSCSGLTSVTIPNSVTSIGSQAFRGCSGLTSITIPSSVTSIGNYTFYGCSGLTSITIPNSVTSIGSSTFQSCSGLTSITIPDGVISIGTYAFQNCTGLTSVTMEGTTPPTLSNINAFPYSNTGFKIYVPCGSKTAYTSATNWSNSSISSKITDALPAEITEDRYLASCDCDFPSTITIKDGASLSASSASSLSTKLTDKTVNVEKELAIDEFSLIGNIGGATDYGFIASNAGDNSGFAHSMVALPFYYEGNSWGVDAAGNGAINGTNTPVSYGESFFVYPTTNQYNTNGTTINGDTYTTLRQSISSSNLKLSNFTVSLTNNNTTKWFALSNPFIGKLNLSKFYTSNNDVLQSTYAYVWDNTEHDWVALDGINTTNKYALYPATGILIEGASANPNPNHTFNFNVADIVTTETITTTKTAQANRVEFTATSNDVEMKMYAHIDENSDNGYGRMDASVLFSNKEDAVNPYFALEGRNIFDNYFSSLPATFDVNFNAYKSNTIDFAVTSSMEGVEVTLIDLATENAETVLNVNEPVTINVTAGQNEGRYQLRFSKKNVGINEVASEENTIQIWNNNSEVSINGKDLKRVEIYNTLGQRVYSSSLVGESTSFDSNLNAGAYIIKVYTANSSKSEKIIIR